MIFIIIIKKSLVQFMNFIVTIILIKINGIVKIILIVKKRTFNENFLGDLYDIHSDFQMNEH